MRFSEAIWPNPPIGTAPASKDPKEKCRLETSRAMWELRGIWYRSAAVCAVGLLLAPSSSESFCLFPAAHFRLSGVSWAINVLQSAITPFWILETDYGGAGSRRILSRCRSGSQG